MLGLHMEDLLLQKDDRLWLVEVPENKNREKRILFYNKRIMEAIA